MEKIQNKLKAKISHRILNSNDDWHLWKFKYAGSLDKYDKVSLDKMNSENEWISKNGSRLLFIYSLELHLKF